MEIRREEYLFAVEGSEMTERKTNYKKVNKYKILYTIFRAKKKINRGPQREEQGSAYLDGRVIEGSSER